MKKQSMKISCLLMIFFCYGIAAAEEITIVGTGSGMALLQSLGDAYMKNNPDITIIIPESIGSIGGIKGVGTDRYRIGRVGRKLKDKEAHYGLTYIPFARLPIVFFTNKNVGLKEISPQAACDIYSGKITNWKDIGGKDARIRVVRREDGDSSLQVLLKSLPGFKDITITKKSKTTLTDQETLEVVESIKDTIAFGTYGNAKIHNVDILGINGKNPAQHEYPYTGSLAIIVKEKNNTGNIQKFIHYLTSREAVDIIKASGGLPF